MTCPISDLTPAPTGTATSGLIFYTYDPQGNLSQRVFADNSAFVYDENGFTPFGSSYAGYTQVTGHMLPVVDGVVFSDNYS